MPGTRLATMAPNMEKTVHHWSGFFVSRVMMIRLVLANQVCFSGTPIPARRTMTAVATATIT